MSASVTVIFGGQEQGNHDLTEEKVVVGREPTCGIPIDNLGISRQHCAFALKGGAYVVQDLGSANGTFVNGKRIVEHYLNDGDEVVIGKYILRFKNEEQAKAAPNRESVGVPDTLNTYVMDGAKIQEQLAKMRAGGNEGEAGAPAQPGPGATAKDYAKALDVPQQGGEMGSLKTLIIVLLVAVFLLVVLVVLFAAGVFSGGGGGGAAPAP
ncbi:MAG: FHA domain-containing protein [Planctomycetota bacterium]|nr:FHA domain-containing protein [Planctomycetota bacterium]